MWNAIFQELKEKPVDLESYVQRQYLSRMKVKVKTFSDI